MKTSIIVHEPNHEGIRVARLVHGARNLAAELDRDASDDDGSLRRSRWSGKKSGIAPDHRLDGRRA